MNKCAYPAAKSTSHKITTLELVTRAELVSRLSDIYTKN